MKVRLLNLKVFILLINMFSCKNSFEMEKINPVPDSKLKNIEISIKGNYQNQFNINVENAIINKGRNNLQLEKVTFNIKDKNEVLFTIYSNKGFYDKKNNYIDLFNIQATNKSKNLKIIADKIQFNEKINQLIAKKVNIKLYEHTIKSDSLNFGNNFKNIHLEKVKAKFILPVKF